MTPDPHGRIGAFAVGAVLLIGLVALGVYASARPAPAVEDPDQAGWSRRLRPPGQPLVRRGRGPGRSRQGPR